MMFKGQVKIRNVSPLKNNAGFCHCELSQMKLDFLLIELEVRIKENGHFNPLLVNKG